MRSSSTASLARVMGNNATQPADTTFTVESFFSMTQVFAFTQMLEFLEPLNEHLSEIGIRHDAGNLVKLLRLIAQRAEKSGHGPEYEVMKFLSVHPDYFSQISAATDIFIVIYDVLFLVNDSYNDNSRPSDIEYAQRNNVKNTALVLSLFQPQLQAFDDYNLLICLLQRFKEYIDATDKGITQGQLFGASNLCVLAMLGAIKNVPALETVLQFIPYSDQKLNIYNTWQSYWLERNISENHNQPAIEPQACRRLV